jgi:AraC family transcriptional regulator
MDVKGQLTVHIHFVYEKPPVPGWSDIRQTINVHSLYWIRSGKGVFITEDQEYRVQKHMLVYLKPGLCMSMKSDIDEPLRITMVMMDCAEVLYLDGDWNSVEPIQDLQLTFWREYSPSEAKQMDSVFNMLLRNDFPRNTISEVQNRSTAIQLIYEIMMREQGQWEWEAGNAFQAYEQIKQHIERHYDQDLKIKALAEKFGISESFLRKMFQRYIRESPKKYLNRIRNEQAIRLLAYTDESMKEIAAACGFADEYHFSKIFKQQNGIPPSKYREKNPYN